MTTTIAKTFKLVLVAPDGSAHDVMDCITDIDRDYGEVTVVREGEDVPDGHEVLDGTDVARDVCAVFRQICQKLEALGVR